MEQNSKTDVSSDRNRPDRSQFAFWNQDTPVRTGLFHEEMQLRRRLLNYSALLAATSPRYYLSFNNLNIREMSRGSFERGSKYGQDIQYTDNGIELPDKRWVEALINDNLRSSQAQSQTQFELCRGAAVNADVSPNLLLLDRSSRGARVRLAA